MRRIWEVIRIGYMVSVFFMYIGMVQYERGIILDFFVQYPTHLNPFGTFSGGGVSRHSTGALIKTS